MNDNQVRESYNKAITNAFINDFAPRFKAFHELSMCFGDDLAREAFETRDRIKSEHQTETSEIGRMAIAMHNLKNYNQLHNPDYEYFRTKSGKNPEDIAYSAFKTGGADMHLTNNGFGPVLDCWKKIRDTHPEIYPEDLLDCRFETLCQPDF